MKKIPNMRVFELQELKKETDKFAIIYKRDMLFIPVEDLKKCLIEIKEKFGVSRGYYELQKTIDDLS